jgi:hypothetical protein
MKNIGAERKNVKVEFLAPDGLRSVSTRLRPLEIRPPENLKFDIRIAPAARVHVGQMRSLENSDVELHQER